MTTTLTRQRRVVVPALVVGVVVVVAVVLWRVQGKDQPTAAPYDDARSAGHLALCSKDGKAVTEGSVGTRPFVAAVVGETGVPSGVDPAGAVATLFAYQPRVGVAASEFSGSAITAASPLADPAHPAVAVTSDAWSIRDFVTAFPASYDGYVQLRLYLGTPQAGTLTDQPYDTADLRVDGDRWRLVDGGKASCDGVASLLP